MSLAQSLPDGLRLGLTGQRCNLSRQSFDLRILDVEGHCAFLEGYKYTVMV